MNQRAGGGYSPALDSVQQLAEPLVHAWLGPKGTKALLHTDPYHSILCQVVGEGGCGVVGQAFHGRDDVAAFLEDQRVGSVGVHDWSTFYDDVNKKSRNETNEHRPYIQKSNYEDLIVMAGRTKRRCGFFPHHGAVMEGLKAGLSVAVF